MQNLIVILVAIGSVVLLVFMLFIAIDTHPTWRVTSTISVIGMTAYPVLTLYYLRLTTAPKDSYLGLVMERRRLEEQAKIDKLRSEMK